MLRVVCCATLVVLLILSSLALSRTRDDCCVGIRGNVDGDPGDGINIVDVTYFVAFMFDGGPEPACPEEADINADGATNIVDVTYLVAYMFDGGPAPAECPVVVEDSVIQHLAVGDEFTGFVTTYNSSGAVVDTGTATATVTNDTLVDGWTWYLMRDQEGVFQSDSTLMSNQPDGLWIWADAFADPPGAKVFTLKYPANPGDSYPLEDFTVTVVSTNASMTVPAGTFSCYQYKVTALFGVKVGELWAAPNIGLVRGDQYNIDGFTVYLESRTELVSYSLAK